MFSVDNRRDEIIIGIDEGSSPDPRDEEGADKGVGGLASSGIINRVFFLKEICMKDA